MILLKEPTIEKAHFTLYVMAETRFCTSEKPKNIMHGIVINGCDALTFLFKLGKSYIDK